MKRIGRKKAWPNGRPRKIITSMIKRRKNLCPTEILRTIRPEIFLTKISHEIRKIHPAIKIILRVKNLLITMVIIPRILSAMNL